MQKLSSLLSLAMIFALKCAQGEDLHTLQACTHLDDDTARLSCYDTAMGVTKSVKPGGSGRVHADTSTQPKTVSARVREVAPLPAGLYRLTLDNGEVWETTQADTALNFKANDAVVLTRGLLSSYQISLAGHNTSVSATRKR